MGKVIYVPKRINTEVAGFISLINLYQKIINSDDKDIILDFQENDFFAANLCAVLGVIEELAEKNGYKIHYINFNDVLKRLFSKNNFLYTYDESCDYKNDTVISYRKFSNKNEYEFISYILNQLLEKNDFPNLSEAAKKAILRSIFEIFENARTHGQCDFIHTCGQYFPNKVPSQLDITIVDLGITIHKNVNDYHQKIMNSVDSFSPGEAIKWAIQPGNTTKVGLTGGLGLGVIIDFLALNKGALQIISNSGYLDFQGDKKNTITKEIPNNFPGTIVNIRFNFDDEFSYSLKDEQKVPLEDIF